MPSPTPDTANWRDRVTVVDLIALLIATGILVALGGQVFFGA